MNTPELKSFALKDAPALIEAVLPAQKVSFEAQRECKAGAGQTADGPGFVLEGAQATDPGARDFARQSAAADG